MRRIQSLMRPLFMDSLARGRAWVSQIFVVTFIALIAVAGSDMGCHVGMAQGVPAAGQRPSGAIGMLGGTEPEGQYPSEQYYIGLRIYRTGDLEQAVNVFESALRTSRRDINGRWIDAIPSMAMLGECYWHLGDLQQSKKYLDDAFQVAIRYRGWLGRCGFDGAVQPGVALARPRWLWPEAAAIPVAPISTRIMFRSGDRLTSERLAKGGRIQEESIRPIDVVEIMRTLAVAAHRRRMILGPLSKNDPMSMALIDSTKYPAGMRLPIGRTLIGAMRAAEKFSNHDDVGVIKDASANAMVGRSVHPLSSIALMSQAQTMVGAKKPSLVLDIAARAANSAAASAQPEWIGEAMQLAAGCADPKTAAVVAKTAGMAAIATRRESRLASLHCLIAAADASVTAGDPASAARFLSEAQSVSNRRDVLMPRLDAYGSYVAARIAAGAGASIGSGRSTETDQAIARIRDFALNHRSRRRALVSMPHLFQLSLIRGAVGRLVGGKTGDLLLNAYSSDPPLDLWRRDPVDALAACMSDRSVARMMRVNLAASNENAEAFLVASDAMLAGRFLDSMPLGGRLCQVRSLVSRDDSMLSADALKFREDAGPTMKKLIAMAGNPGPPDPSIVEGLEAKAASLALDRMNFPAIAPPAIDAKKPIATLPERTGLLTFTIVGNKLFGVMAVDGKAVMWNIAGANRLPGEIGRLLKAIGVGKSRGKRIPEDESWKAMAVSLRQRIFPDDQIFASGRLKHLIIVPDGPLWYLPFEILPLADEKSPLIADQISIRYAATPGLAVKPIAAPATSQAIGLTTSPFFAPKDPELAESMVQGILDVIDQPVRLPQPEMIPTAFLGNQMGHLVVASPQAANLKSPLMTQVADYDSASSYGTLAAWIRFPARSPASVVSMGMRTPVGVGQMGDGTEVFATLCALQVSGVRSVLLSRWAVGGESTAMLLRELVQELPFTGLAASFWRARSVLRSSMLDPAAEPLLSRAESDVPELSGNQPLFWAGYLVSSPE